MYLVMFEIHGNQCYVFASPRPKENIGASYLLTLPELWMRSMSQHERTPTLDVSVSSGEMIIAVDPEKNAHSFVSVATRKILETAPGVDVTGVFTPMTLVHVTKEDLENVHAALAHHVLMRPPTLARFCSTSSLEPGRDTLLLAVSSRVGSPPGEAYSLSGTAVRAQASKTWEYLLDLASTHPHFSEQSEEFLSDPDALEEALDSLSRVAVIHFDGNGVGAMVRGPADRSSSIPVSIFQEQIRCDASDADALGLSLLELNKRLDNVMKDAFCDTWATMADLAIQEGIDAVPVIPVILGGDDAIVITDGAFAVPFTVTFPEAFEERTGVDPFISPLSDDGKMTAGAGVAVVRYNFPFYLAYDFVERLASTVKTTGKRMNESCSILSYYIPYDPMVLDPEGLPASYTPFANKAEAAQSVPAMTSRPYRTLARKELSTPLPSPTTNESWDVMRLRAAWFVGTLSTPGASIPMRFPKSRAARIRKILSDAVHLPGQEQCSHLAKVRSERDDTRSQRDFKVFVDVIGSERLTLDLINLAEILPRTYLAASAPEELSWPVLSPPILIWTLIGASRQGLVSLAA